MSENEINHVSFLRFANGFPQVNGEDTDAEYWIEWAYYELGKAVWFGQDFIAFKEYVGEFPMAGLFTSNGNADPTTEDIQALNEQGFELETQVAARAIMIHYNGSDDYLVDLETWEDVKNELGLPAS